MIKRLLFGLFLVTFLPTFVLVALIAGPYWIITGKDLISIWMTFIYTKLDPDGV